MQYSSESEPLGWNIIFFTTEILKRFMISKKKPSSLKEHEELINIKKNLSLLIWIGKSQILSKEEENKLVEEIKDLNSAFKQKEIFDKLQLIIQHIKNRSNKISILQSFTEIEYIACIDINGPQIEPESLHDLFEKIIHYLKKPLDNFSIMKLERSIQEIQKKYIENPSDIRYLEENLKSIVQILT